MRSQVRQVRRGRQVRARALRRRESIGVRRPLAAAAVSAVPARPCGAIVGWLLTGLTYFFVYLAVLLCLARGLPVIAEFVYSQKRRHSAAARQEAMTLAIFDIDGTLVRGSTERRFWRYLVARRRQGPRQISGLCLVPAALSAALWHSRRQEEQGLSRRAHDGRRGSAGGRFRGERGRAAASQPGRPAPATTSATRRHGGAALRHARADRACARAPARSGARVRDGLRRTRDGRYLARPPRRHPFGAEKLALAAELATRLGTDLRHASAYADSAHDLELLEAVGSPVAVWPDQRLLLGGARKRLGRDRADRHARRGAPLDASRGPSTCRRAGCSRRDRTARCDYGPAASPCRAPCRQPSTAPRRS